jgi:large subunit ribosomal protein L22
MARQAGEIGQQRATAGARYVRVSASKVRVVAALIRGKHVDEARRILAFTPKAASHHLSKVLESAIANAEHNFDIPGDELYVAIVAADEGPTLKRIRPRAQGRAYRVRKRTSHIRMILVRGESPEAQQAARRRRSQGPAGSQRAAASGGGSAAERRRWRPGREKQADSDVQKGKGESRAEAAKKKPEAEEGAS